jgi:PAS domain S-box-containing protein
MGSTLKTREELQAELQRLQARLVELERTEAEREQAVAALRESEERWRSLVQNAPNIIFTVDQEGRILFINRTVIGFTVEQVVGSSSYNYVPAEFHDTMRKTFARVFQTGEAEDYESESLGDHCKPAWYSNRIGAIRKNGKVDTAIVIASDITERKRADKALQEGEERLQEQFRELSLVYQCSPVGLSVLDRNLRFLRINQRLAEINGVPIEEHLGRTIFEVVPDLAEHLQRLWRPVFEKGEPVLDVEIQGETLKTPGEQRHWLASYFPVKSAAGEVTGLIAAVSEITERKRAEDELRRSEERHRTILHTTMDGFWRVDTRGRLLEVNESYCRMSGYSMQELLAMGIPDLEAIETASDIAMHIRNIMAKGSGRFESQHRRKNGTVFDVEVSVQYQPAEGRQFVAFLRDITKRKLAEEALHTSEEKFKALAEQSITGICLIQDGRFVYVNPRLAEILDFRQEEMIALPVLDLVAEPDRDMVRENMRNRLSGEVLSVRYTFHALKKGGTEVPLEVHGSVMTHRTRPAVLATVLDISERKRAEEEREDLEAQLRQAQKMQVVGQLAGGVAHDFNNILTAILGNAERLLVRMELSSDEIPTEVTRSGLEEIKFAAERAAALTRQLLAFSRKEIKRSVVLDLGRLIRDKNDMLRRILREDIVFDVKVASDTRRIRADAAQFEQVIMNLVLNARDAMRTRGTLTITCANTDFDEVQAAAHLGAKPGPHVMLAVSDTGVGMSKETMEHMFEPFFTTKPTGKGTGLGLATVYGIVRQTGGHISVESELGKGSTFRVYFPAVEEEASKSETPPSVEVGGDEVILVCEDEELVRRGVCKDLRAAGYTVLEAENGKHALDVAAGYGDKIDLLVSDVIMPEMNGKQLAEAMTTRYPEMRIVFVSGYTDDVLDDKVCRGEGRDFLQKPFAPNDLLRRVRNLLDQS